jgi:hypothetical protein
MQCRRGSCRKEACLVQAKRVRVGRFLPQPLGRTAMSQLLKNVMSSAYEFGFNTSHTIENRLDL